MVTEEREGAMYLVYCNRNNRWINRAGQVSCETGFIQDACCFADETSAINAAKSLAIENNKGYSVVKVLARYYNNE